MSKNDNPLDYSLMTNLGRSHKTASGVWSFKRHIVLSFVMTLCVVVVQLISSYAMSVYQASRAVVANSSRSEVISTYVHKIDNGGGLGSIGGSLMIFLMNPYFLMFIAFLLLYKPMKWLTGINE